MKNKQQYFEYRCPDMGHWFLIGENEGQIIDTLRYYRDERKGDVAVPSESMIQPSTKELNIYISLPLVDPEQNLVAKVSDALKFTINANAFDYFQRFVKDYEGHKRGELYKFKSTLTEPRIYFLPKSVMESLKWHEWTVSDMMNIDEWNRDREQRIRGIKKSGKFCLPQIK